MYELKDHSEIEWLGGKAVPTHLFKVIIEEKEDGTVIAEGCVVPKLDKKDEGEKGPEEVEMSKEDEDKIDLKKESDIIQMDKEDEVINFYSQLPERIEILSGLKFLSHSKVGADRIETIKWKGEGKTGELCSVEIKVRISSVQGETHQIFFPNRNIHLR